MAVATHQQTDSKRLVLFFDGTWDKPDNYTNVYRLFLMLGEVGEDGKRQIHRYDEGVGTHWFDRISGGAFGWGLSDNVCNAYRWLMENYNENDEIFLLGFSRGAFTARSLAGLIASCGLLKPDAPISFRQIFDRYRREALPVYTLRYQKAHAPRVFDFEESALLDHTYYHRDLIKMVGVWDTVGALGIPLGNIPGISRRTLRFHNTRLSTVVQNSFQAMAVDEQRKPYQVLLWTEFVPDIPDSTQSAQPDHRMIEQRWFSGSHCNVGGGYADDAIAQLPLCWLQQKAKDCQLGFRSLLTGVQAEGLATRPHDSYAEFLGGLWGILNQRHCRPIEADPVRKQNATVHTVNERIDRSVFERCLRYPDYRPENLCQWAQRKRLDLEDVIAHLDNYPSIYAPVSNTGIESMRPEWETTARA
jgi:hypothetical protein